MHLHDSNSFCAAGPACHLGAVKEESDGTFPRNDSTSACFFVLFFLHSCFSIRFPRGKSAALPSRSWCVSAGQNGASCSYSSKAGTQRFFVSTFLHLASAGNCGASNHCVKRSNQQYIEPLRMHAKCRVVPRSMQKGPNVKTKPSAGIEPATFRLLSGCSTD